MASKKYSLLTGIVCLLASYGFSQTTTTGTGYDVMDSSVISSRRMPQYTNFKQGLENYPAKPRNQWEVGIKGGTFTMSSHVAALFPTFGGGIHIRKAFGYVFSMRLEYMYGIGKGLNYVPSVGYKNNTPWIAAGYNAPAEQVYYNYKTRVQDLSLNGIFSLNNIRFHKSSTGVNFYALAGLGGMIYDTKLNLLNSSGQKYNFSGITGGSFKNRKQTRDALKAMMDGSYETPALSQGDRRPKLFGQTFRPIGNVGVGVAFKLSNKINLALEDRVTFTADNYMDGEPYQEHPQNDPALAPKQDLYNYATLGLNFNLGAKSVQPLWWMNPLDYAYQEIRKPKYMILPKPVLPDSDGDGVTDQFDLEPNTPAGCPVDTHGVSLDTDGDGVPDCRDKEKITPTYCQPVDKDGVGKCPCPDSTCFDKYMTKRDECSVSLGTLPSVTFTGNTVSLSNDAKALLASVAARLRQSPTCRVVVTGYCSSSKADQQRSWDRVNSIINYMVEKEGISQDRFIFNYGQEGGDCNTVDLRAAAEGEQGQATVPAPHPNLSRKK